MISGSGPVQDLDWTTTSDLQSVLAVGFPHEVVLVCEQRMSYTEKTPGWAPFITISLEKLVLPGVCRADNQVHLCSNQRLDMVSRRITSDWSREPDLPLFPVLRPRSTRSVAFGISQKCGSRSRRSRGFVPTYRMA